MRFVGPILSKLWTSSIWGFLQLMASRELLMQTCWWPFCDQWSVQLSSSHLSGFVQYSGLKAKWSYLRYIVQNVSLRIVDRLSWFKRHTKALWVVIFTGFVRDEGHKKGHSGQTSWPRNISQTTGWFYDSKAIWKCTGCIILALDQWKHKDWLNRH